MRVSLQWASHVGELLLDKRVGRVQNNQFTAAAPPTFSLNCFRVTASLSIYLSIGINVRFAAMMADVGDGLL